MASERFEEIIPGQIPAFQFQWLKVGYTLRDAEDFLNDNPVCSFFLHLLALSTWLLIQVCGRCIRLGVPCRKMESVQEIPTNCLECYRSGKRCRRTVDFMARMLSRTAARTVQDIIEEWEAELTPSREVYQKVIELRAALEERETQLWRKGVKMEEQKRRVEMLIGLVGDAYKEVESVEDKNKDLQQQVYELEEENQRLNDRLTFMRPQETVVWVMDGED